MRPRGLMTVALTGVLVIMAVAPAWAHHAFAAEFDAKKPVKFKATVTQMEWTNPHVWIHVDVKQPNYWAGKTILYTQKAPAPVLRADHTAESLIVARALSRRTEDDPTRNHDDQASEHDQLELV